MVAEMGNPLEPGRISVTMKGDARESTWTVFHGSVSEVRRQIVEFFGLDGEDETPMFDLVNEATRLYKAAGNASAGLGGRVVGSNNGSTRGGAGSGSAWDSTEPAEPQETVDINVVRLTKAIEAATSTAGLREIFARDKAHFDANPELLTEWKAKGKSLS